MQPYLGLHGPDPNDDHLGPAGLHGQRRPRTRTSCNAYFALVPYEIFADPDANLFVTREGGNGVYGPASCVADLEGEAPVPDR